MFKVNKKKPSANVQHTIRFDEDLHEQLNRMASEEQVSFNHYVLECCRYALSESDKKEEAEEALLIKIIKRHNKGESCEEIAINLKQDLEIVKRMIADYEMD